MGEAVKSTSSFIQESVSLAENVPVDFVEYDVGPGVCCVARSSYPAPASVSKERFVSHF